MEFFSLIILIIFFLVGILATLFFDFGNLIIFIGCLVFALLTGFSVITLRFLIFLLVLYLLGELFEFLFTIIVAKRFGASNKAIIGALVGGIVGAILGTALLGVGVILGSLFGIFFGAFLIELMSKRDVRKSMKTGAGGVMGRIVSVGAKLLIGLIMIALVAYRIISYATLG